MLNDTEREELDSLRRSALRFVNDPLERAFMELERTIEHANSKRVDAILPTNAFHVLSKALIELKRKVES